MESDGEHRKDRKVGGWDQETIGEEMRKCQGSGRETEFLMYKMCLLCYYAHCKKLETYASSINYTY